MLYFAYGSNLDTDQMLGRCPRASAVASATLHGWRLRFAGGGHADVVRDESRSVPGALYELEPSDVRALDRYEGVAGGYYLKIRVTVIDSDGRTRRPFMYVMTPGQGVRRPLPHYVRAIMRGYADWGLDHRELAEALCDCETEMLSCGT